MVNVAIKYGVHFHTPNPSQELREALPLFHHFGEDKSKRRINNSAACKCLRGKHGASTQGDAVRISERFEDPEHVPDKRCTCNDCVGDRALLGCKNPHGCAKTARLKLDSLLPEWDPRRQAPYIPQQGDNDSDDLLTFVGPPPVPNLTEGFRIFTRAKAEAVIQAPQQAPAQVAGPVTISVAGATVQPGTADARAGSGIWSEEAQIQDMSISLPEEMDQSTSNAEVVAALTAMRQTRIDTELQIESGSRFLLKAMSTQLPKWEDKGWTGVQSREPLQALAASLRGRTAATKIAVMRESAGRAEADRLARAGTQRQTSDAIDTQIPTHLQLRGAKLSSLTQADAYKAIKDLRKQVIRKSTDENVRRTQEAVKACYGKNPTPASLWKSIRNRDISRQIRNFLWKSMHGAHRIGKFWLNIPDMDDRAQCQHCGGLEDMEHILVHCSRPGRHEIWELAKKLWLMKHKLWPIVSLGSILGAGLATFEDDENKKMPNTARLYRILMTESMYLIWKIRCEVVIGNDGAQKTPTEIHNRWVAALNERLEIDRNLTNQMRFGKQYSLAPSLVLETWRGTLKDEDKSPDRWLSEPEVLVGIVPIRSLRSPSPPVGRRGRNR
ncbi:hypothetical protein DFH06DRAFT_982886 [Mycena polygramma]|nr:hypothetical protein DFH06DRAFT_982886 [Mycena polygramma]